MSPIQSQIHMTSANLLWKTSEDKASATFAPAVVSLNFRMGYLGKCSDKGFKMGRTPAQQSRSVPQRQAATWGIFNVRNSSETACRPLAVNVLESSATTVTERKKDMTALKWSNQAANHRKLDRALRKMLSHK